MTSVQIKWMKKLSECCIISNSHSVLLEVVLAVTVERNVNPRCPTYIYGRYKQSLVMKRKISYYHGDPWISHDVTENSVTEPPQQVWIGVTVSNHRPRHIWNERGIPFCDIIRWHAPDIGIGTGYQKFFVDSDTEYLKRNSPGLTQGKHSLVPRPHIAFFQCIHKKSARAWYLKSHALCTGYIERR